MPASLILDFHKEFDFLSQKNFFIRFFLKFFSCLLVKYWKVEKKEFFPLHSFKTDNSFPKVDTPSILKGFRSFCLVQLNTNKSFISIQTKNLESQRKYFSSSKKNHNYQDLKWVVCRGELRFLKKLKSLSNNFLKRVKQSCHFPEDATDRLENYWNINFFETKKIFQFLLIDLREKEEKNGIFSFKYFSLSEHFLKSFLEGVVLFLNKFKVFPAWRVHLSFVKIFWTLKCLFRSRNLWNKASWEEEFSRYETEIFVQTILWVKICKIRLLNI